MSQTSTKQFEKMVDFMEKHPRLARGMLKTNVGKEKSKKLWDELSKILNKNGPPIKRAPGWKKVWADYKHHTKTKIMKNAHYARQTGNCPPKTIYINALEERVVELVNIHAPVRSTCNPLAHFARRDNIIIPSETVSSEMDMNSPLDDDDEEIISEAVITKNTELPLFVEEQVESEGNFQKEIVQMLGIISTQMNDNYKLNKRKLRIQEKENELEEKRLKLEERRLYIEEKRLYIEEKRLNIEGKKLEIHCNM